MGKNRYRGNIYTVTIITLEANTKKFIKHFIESYEEEKDALEIIYSNMKIIEEYNMKKQDPLWDILVFEKNGIDTDNGRLFLSSINKDTQIQTDIYLDCPEYYHYS